MDPKSVATTRKSSVVCVLGMHRSGTSLVSRIVNLLGFSVGLDAHLMAPEECNPKGFWEHTQITSINEEILSRLGGSWHQPPSFFEGWESEASFGDLRQKARSVIEADFGNVDSWSWKDPRGCLTLPFWQRLLPHMIYVIILRNPVDVALSLKKRDQFSLEKGIDLWLKHVTFALRYTSAQPRIFLFYEDLLRDLDSELDRLAQFLNVVDAWKRQDTRDEIRSFKDALLCHHQTSLIDVIDNPALAFSAKALYLVISTYVRTCRDDSIVTARLEREIQQALDHFAEYSSNSWEELRCLKSEIGYSKEQLLLRDNSLSEALQSLQQANATISQLEEEAKNLKIALGAEEQAVCRNEVEIGQLQTQHIKLAQQLESSIVLVDKYRAEVDILRENNQNLSRDLKSAGEDLSRKEQEVTRLRAENSKIITERNGVVQEIQSVRWVLNNLSGELATIKNTLGWKILDIYRRLRNSSQLLSFLHTTITRLLKRRRIDRTKTSRDPADIPDVGNIGIYPGEGQKAPNFEIVGPGIVQTDSDDSRIQLERRAEAPPINDAKQNRNGSEDILYSIDSLALRAGRVYGWGWLLHKSRPISSLRLVARTKKHTYPVPCQYGVRRDDVGRTQELNGAQNSGFLILSRLPQEKLIELFLEVELEGGEICRIDCHDFETIVQRSQFDAPYLTDAVRLKGVRRIAHFGRRGIAYVARGDWKGLHTKIEKTLERSRALGNSLPVFSSQEFLDQLGSSKDKEFVLLIDHNLGGGANQYRTKVISKSLENDRPVLLLFYNLWRLHYSIRYLDQGRDLVFDVESLDSIFSLTKSLHVKEIFLNNTVSFDDPLTFATLLPQLKRVSGADLTIALHDYFALCPSWNLLDDAGQSCGVPSMDRCRQCLPNLHNALSFWVDVKTIDQWRELWSGCLEEATQILCFSRSSIELLRRAYPALEAGKIKHQPHTLEDFPRKKIQSHIGSRLNIGIVGEITMPKGAGIVVEMARLILDRQLPVKITVIGSIEGLVESDAVSITGPYVRQNLPGIIEKVRANVFFVPSIWPETFSYVTAELMEMGVPVAVFNLGAQGERVATYPLGLVIHEIDSANALDQLIAFHAKLRESESPASDEGRFA